MDGFFTGYKLVHPSSGLAPHDVVVSEAAGQTTLVCLTCETFQTVDSIASGAKILAAYAAETEA